MGIDWILQFYERLVRALLAQDTMAVDSGDVFASSDDVCFLL